MGFVTGFTAGANVRANRDARREQAKEKENALLAQGYSFEDGQMNIKPGSKAELEQLQVQEAIQLSKSLQGKLSAQETDTAFDEFSQTGDATYLQKALDSNPVLKKAWGEKGVQMVGNIDFETDKNMLAKAGLSSEYFDTNNKKDIIKRNMYKVYNGKNWDIALANNAMSETGAYKRLGKRRSEIAQNNYKDLVSLMSGPKVSSNTAEGHKYEDLIKSAAEKYDLPPNLIAAQMTKESSNRPDAVSPKGAGGLMQIMPETAKDLGISDVFDPAQSIEGGAKYMRQLLDRYDGDLTKALAAYNAGMGNVDKYGGVPPFGETQDYVNTIMGNLDKGESYYGRSAERTADTILEHRRRIALAEKGLSPKDISRDADIATRTSQQKDIELRQKGRSLSQKDTELDIKQQAIEAKLKTEGTTTKQKNLNAAESITTSMLDTFGGEEEFMTQDFSDPKKYRQAYKSIVKIEALEGTELSDADKKKITDIRQLISLGDPAAKLTTADTGLIDNTLGNMQKYFKDNVKGVAAKSAYSAFRNSVRHALFGSALTEAEIKSFKEAYGTLGQQLGPVLEMFETSLSQVQAKLDSTANLMNPYSAKVRLGADQDKILKVQDALQARIDYVKGLTTPSSDRKPLDDIFKGSK